jgi:hypothetical protein
VATERRQQARWTWRTIEIFNTDQSSQFTSAAFTGTLAATGGSRWTVEAVTATREAAHAWPERAVPATDVLGHAVAAVTRIFPDNGIKAYSAQSRWVNGERASARTSTSRSAYIVSIR